MCVIIDANRASSFCSSSCPDGTPVFEWVRAGKAKVVIGGKLTAEWVASGCGALMEELARRGHCIILEGKAIQTAAKKLRDDRRLKSNDKHVIAAAQLSGARLIYTVDGKLIQDFQGPVLKSPRGQVYSSAQDAALLDDTHCNPEGCAN